MVRYEVDVFADTICPWCFIGMKTLDLAIERHRSRHPEDEFHLTWRPFMLFPNAKVSAYNKKDSFLLKFGPNALNVLDRMDRAGAPYGLRFNWEGRTGSSRDSHKLILLAAEQDAAAAAAATISSFSSTSSSVSAPTTDTPSSSVASPSEMETHLPHGPSCPPATSSASYSNNQPPSPMEIDTTSPSPSFSSRSPNPKMRTLLHTLLLHALTLGADISSRETFLVPLALSHGLAVSEANLLAQLDSPELNARVDAEMVRARQEVGVTAVPSYVVNGRYRVGGWQEPGVFEGLFERIRVRGEDGV